MLDCLPHASEWSPESQYAMLQSQLLAAREHLEALESAAAQGVTSLFQARPHLQELNQCCLEADQLLLCLGQLPAEKLQSIQHKMP